MTNGYFELTPVLVMNPSNQISRQSPLSSSSNESRGRNDSDTLKVGRPQAHSLKSTQDIMQHKITIERIANAFAT